jgi:histone-lysine N-methyltransferase EZH2
MSLDPSTSDNAGPLETPDLVPSPNSDDEKIEQNRTLVFLVYKEVWDEFYKWKVEDCKQQLRLLEQPLPPQSVAESTKRLASAFRTDLDSSEPGEIEIIYICDTEDDIPLDIINATVLTCEDVSLRLPPNFKPHPRYESCTASVQTIALREASAAYEEAIIAPFVPYADSDDPNWNIRSYLEQFDSFAWERLVDPDGRRVHLSFELAHASSLIPTAMTVEVIQFEVLRRLHVGHGLSLEDIDVTGFLPESRPANRYGLIYQMTQRCVGLRL